MSGHGFSQNQLTVWKYPTLTKVRILTGNFSYLLHRIVGNFLTLSLKYKKVQTNNTLNIMILFFVKYFYGTIGTIY